MAVTSYRVLLSSGEVKLSVPSGSRSQVKLSSNE